jgi:hypothetical protein
MWRLAGFPKRAGIFLVGLADDDDRGQHKSVSETASRDIAPRATPKTVPPVHLPFFLDAEDRGFRVQTSQTATGKIQKMQLREKFARYLSREQKVAS